MANGWGGCHDGGRVANSRREQISSLTLLCLRLHALDTTGMSSLALQWKKAGTHVTSERCGGWMVAPHEAQNCAYGWLLARHREHGRAAPGAAGCSAIKNKRAWRSQTNKKVWFCLSGKSARGKNVSHFKISQLPQQDFSWLALFLRMSFAQLLHLICRIKRNKNTGEQVCLVVRF